MLSFPFSICTGASQKSRLLISKPLSGNSNLDLFRLRLLILRETHSEYAILKLSLYLIGIGIIWESKALNNVFLVVLDDVCQRRPFGKGDVFPALEAASGIRTGEMK